jgi:hypothetical protein
MPGFLKNGFDFIFFINLLYQEVSMGTFVSSRARLFFSMAAIMIFSSLVLVGCGKDNNPNDSGGSLVLGANQAWVDDMTGMTGYVFGNDNKVKNIMSIDGGTTWMLATTENYTVSGSTLTMSITGVTVDVKYTFKVSGNSLTLTPEGGAVGLTYTKKNVTIPNGGGSSNLILGPGEGWADDYPAGERDGFVFLEGGIVLFIDDEDGDWEIFDVGTWSVSGNTLTITDEWMSLNFTYSISGNTLTLTHPLLGSQIYTKVSGINTSMVKARENSERPAFISRKEQKSRAN